MECSHKTLVVGDLHFNHTPNGLLEAQKNTTIRILSEGAGRGCREVIFLGDLMMHRRPTPSVLLALKEVMAFCKENFYTTYVLRGNHDSENRNDDGVTALSLFDDDPHIKVITTPYEEWSQPFTFIPHYEDEEVIKDCLANASEGNIVFGHFGYHGCLNSTGDADFGLSIDLFKNRTVLGHIHKHGGEGNVSVLGTPYSTNFGEAGKDCWYGVIGVDKEIEFFPIDFGVRHLVVDYNSVRDNLDWINHSEYYTMLRINVHSVYDADEGMAELVEQLNVAGVEIKYVPFTDDRDEFTPEKGSVSLEVTDDLIESYINNTPTKINKEMLLEGLKLIHEDQENRGK